MNDQLNIQATFESAPVLHTIVSPGLTISSISDRLLTPDITNREGILGKPMFRVFPVIVKQVGWITGTVISGKLAKFRFAIPT